MKTICSVIIILVMIIGEYFYGITEVPADLSFSEVDNKVKLSSEETKLLRKLSGLLLFSLKTVQFP